MKPAQNNNGCASAIRLVNVVAANEEDGGNEAWLEKTHLDGLLRELQEHHGWRSGDAGQNFWSGALGAVELQYRERESRIRGTVRIF